MPNTPLTIVIVLLVVGLLAAPLVMALLLRRNVRRTGPLHRLCAKCGYDVETSLGTVARCPECGSVLAVVGVIDPNQRRGRILLLTITLVGIALMLAALGLAGFAAATAAAQHQASARAAVAAEQAARQRAEAAMQASLEAAAAAESRDGDSSSRADPE